MNFAGPERTAAAKSVPQTADLTVVGGGGHVGIPLVLAFAEAGFRVNVNDINREVLETLKAGRLPFIENGGEALLTQALQRDRLVFTERARRHFHAPARSSSPSARRSTNSSIRRARSCRTASTICCRICADGQLLVLRSTRLSRHDRLGRRLSQAQGPRSQDRVLSRAGGAGLRHPRARRDAADRQRHDAGGARRRPPSCSPRSRRNSSCVTPREAEFAKLFNNAYRYIEFAAANQFYLIAKSAGRRLPARPRGDEAQLSARAEHSLAGPRRRSVPVQGHDAACRLRAEPVQPRQCGDAGERGPGAARRRRSAPPLRSRAG